MPLRDGFFSTATQTSCCNRIQRSNRVRLLVVSTHDFPDSGLVWVGQELRKNSNVILGGYIGYCFVTSDEPAERSQETSEKKKHINCTTRCHAGRSGGSVGNLETF